MSLFSVTKKDKEKRKMGTKVKESKTSNEVVLFYG